METPEERRGSGQGTLKQTRHTEVHGAWWDVPVSAEEAWLMSLQGHTWWTLKLLFFENDLIISEMNRGAYGQVVIYQNLKSFSA